MCVYIYICISLDGLAYLSVKVLLDFSSPTCSPVETHWKPSLFPLKPWNSPENPDKNHGKVQSNPWQASTSHTCFLSSICQSSCWDFIFLTLMISPSAQHSYLVTTTTSYNNKHFPLSIPAHSHKWLSALNNGWNQNQLIFNSAPSNLMENTNPHNSHKWVDGEPNPK